MEEFVGKVWHRLITRSSADSHVSVQVDLSEIQQQLTLFYRAVGGEAGKIIVPAQARSFSVGRRLIQRIAGTNHKHAVAWQDEQYINLPAHVNYFADRKLNEALYFWLAALAAKLPNIHHWFMDNQQASVELLQTRPGLKELYYQLVCASIAKRTPVENLRVVDKKREQAIRSALTNPGSVTHLPPAKPGFSLVCLWLYPPPLRSVALSADDEAIESGGSKIKQCASVNTRKQARRIDDNKQTDGMLVFQAESLCTWAEQVELDRCQHEDLDDDMQAAVEDLDIVRLSRRRRAGSAKIKFDLDLPAAQNDDLPLGEGIKLPEWDYRKSAFIPAFCLVQPLLADQAKDLAIPDHLKIVAAKLKKRFSALHNQRRWQKYQSTGDEINLDAWLRKVTQPVQDVNRVDYYQSRIFSQRDVACLLLADLSMSTDTVLTDQQRVIDVIKDTLLLFAEALSDVGDQFAIYGFSSVRNKLVRYHILKNFSESYSAGIRGRIMATQPGFYTRMGAAIRQSTEILKTRPAQQRLLMVISDGKPNDIDHYEGRYGIEDTRRAIFEARQQNLHPFCVTIDDKANDYLPYLFGNNGFVIVNDVSKLPQLLPRVYLRITAGKL